MTKFTVTVIEDEDNEWSVTSDNLTRALANAVLYIENKFKEDKIPYYVLHIDEEE